MNRRQARLPFQRPPVNWRCRKRRIGSVSPIAPRKGCSVRCMCIESHDPDLSAHGAPAQQRVCAMQQQISVITLGISELARSRRFYTEGFGWKPVFENQDIIFYKM